LSKMEEEKESSGGDNGNSRTLNEESGSSAILRPTKPMRIVMASTVSGGAEKAPKIDLTIVVIMGRKFEV